MSVTKSIIKTLIILSAIVSLNACVVRAHHPDAYGEPHLHGSLHAWYYYPNSEVYFHITDRYYYYYDGFAWVKATVLPRGWVLNPQFRVRINLDGRPYLKHSQHQRKYPGRRPNHGQSPRHDRRDDNRHDNGRRDNGRHGNGRSERDRRERWEDRHRDGRRDDRHDNRRDHRHEEHHGDDRRNVREGRGDRDRDYRYDEKNKNGKNSFVPHTKGGKKGEKKSRGEEKVKAKSRKEAKGKYKNKNKSGLIEEVRDEVNRKSGNEGNKGKSGKFGKGRKRYDDDD